MALPTLDSGSPVSVTPPHAPGISLGMEPVSGLASRPLLGVTAIVFGLLAFSIQDVIIKHYAARFSILQIMLIRAVVTVAILSAVVLTTRAGRQTLRPVRLPRLMLRGLLGFLSYLGYYLAIAVMPLAQAIAIVFTAPIFVTVFSALLLGERVGARRWMAVLTGFVAVLIVLGPQGTLLTLASGLAFAAAITYAGSILLTAYVSRDNNTLTIMFYAALIFLLGVLLTQSVVWALPATLETHRTLDFLLRPWATPVRHELLIFVAIGVLTTLGQFGLVTAYTVAPMSLIAPFEYSYIVWSVLFGYLVWHDIPSMTTWLGTLLLVVSNLYILYRERHQTSA